jgi:2-phospho-L-lactate guanylyltransferase
MGVWAVVPVKELDRAKERLAPVLPPERRRALMLAMLEDVLTALAATTGLSGLAVVTLDAAACRLAARYGARIIETGARDGHSGAVAAAARLLAAEGCPGMLTLPGDIPLVTPAEITQLLAAHRPAPACPCALARTAFSRICGRPRHAASARPCCACRALRSMSIRRRIWPL